MSYNHKEYMKQYRKDNKEKMKEYQKVWRATPQQRERENERMRNNSQKVRMEGVELLGGKCVDCGATNNLEFDHIVPKDKSHICNPQCPSKFFVEIKKCELRCRPCHLIRTGRQQTLAWRLLESLSQEDLERCMECIPDKSDITIHLP